VRDGKPIRATAERVGMHPKQVARIVKRDTYKREPRIVDPRIWNQAQAALASRRRH